MPSERTSLLSPVLAPSIATLKHGGIGLFGSMVLLFNNITGPGLVSFPVLFQRSGYALPCVVTLIVALMSGIGGTLTVRAMSLMPGNADLSEKVEFVTMGTRLLRSKAAYYIFQVLLNLSLQLVNIASIAVCVDSMDSALIAIFGKTCGLVLNVHGHSGFMCVEAQSENASPFGNEVAITLGFLIVLACVLPLSVLNIEDNIIVQIVCALLFIAVLAVWVVEMLLIGPTHRAPAELKPFTVHQSGIVGVVLLNFAFVTTVPSWICEKRRGVSVQYSLWPGIWVSALIYCGIGALGARTFHFDSSSTLLSVLSDSHRVSKLCRASTYIYPIVSLMSGIPVFSIVVRENLLEGKVCNRFWAIIIACGFPWLISVPLGNGAAFNDLVSYASTVLNAPICFLVPPVFFWLAYKMYIRDRPFEPAKFKSIQDTAEAVRLQREEDEAAEFHAIPKLLRFFSEKTWAIIVGIFSFVCIAIMIGLLIDEHL